MPSVPHKNHFITGEQQQAIIDRYFRNVSTADLAMQFNCPEQTIKDVLFENDIQLANPKPPKWRKRFRKKRKT